VAIFKPSLADLGQLLTPLNEGERAVADALARLDDGWTIYVQPRLAQDMPDFVALHDRFGVCAIEVKDWARGGYRQNDNGAIEYCCGELAWKRSAEQPRYQAYRYRTTIYDQFFASPDDGSKPTEVIRAAVILPRYSNADANKLLQRPAVTSAEHGVRVWGGDDLVQSVEKIVKGVGCTTPAATSMERLRRHLVASEILLELQSPVNLSRDARNVEQNPSNARVRRVRGPAGCGKSFGLAARAGRLAADHKRVLVLSFNVTLANYLRTLVTARCHEYAANPSLVTCVNFHSFCQRIVDDAERAGTTIDDVRGQQWFDAIFGKAQQALESRGMKRFDAVLIDEGQDFTLDWWNMLRHHVVEPDGEMLLVADPTQDVYDKQSWTDNERMLGAGFSGPWTELKGSYRLPNDMIPIANEFARRYVTGERLTSELLIDHEEIVQRESSTRRRWFNLDRVSDLGQAIGEEVVRLLSDNPTLAPRDVVFLCEHHEDGLEAVEEIERAGHAVHHIFSRNERSRATRKRRFWPDADGIKGCTVHSFKGWETPALVMGVSRNEQSRRLAYVAMTRIAGRAMNQPGYLSVINNDLTIAGFHSTFEAWEPPRAELRVL
jgi:hypothetical protein